MIEEKSSLAEVLCAQLRGVGPSLSKRLSELGIHTVQDLLFYLPSSYQDRTRLTPIRHLRPKTYALIEGVLEKSEVVYTRRRSLRCVISDQSGSIALRFFHFTNVQKQNLTAGKILRCFGEVRFGYQGIEMYHPEYQLLKEGEVAPLVEELTPIYPTVQGFSQQRWRDLIVQALHLLNSGGGLQDYIPHVLLPQQQMMGLAEAINIIQNPPVEMGIAAVAENSHPARQRLVFEELLAYQLAVRQFRAQLQDYQAPALQDKKQLIHQFKNNLPFQLTQAQQRVCNTITEDLQKNFPMLRLLQGDVGSGKTVVAALAMLQAVSSGYQTALMAPTELLAEQHFQNLQRWFAPLQIEVVLVVGSLTTKQRREVNEKVALGQAKIIVGTHALFQKEVEFHQLGLIVVDEQHRFGVHQRLALREKGRQANESPHQLIMTATPIPRTLTMTAYADLSVSVIDELPPGRQPIITVAMSNQRRDEIIERVRQVCAEKKQVYWVCPLIEESEVLNCQAAEVTAQTLCEHLPELKIGLVHGRLKAKEKEQVMAEFKQSEIDLLVATTVIEVGVDVPNASLMIIENAERLGLAQLHQLRGRIGRGSLASSCVLLYQAPLNQIAKERLAIMRQTQDGFLIAQRDLELRGPGEILGTKQTGLLQLRMADLLRDQHLLPAVQKAADKLLTEHPDIVKPLIERWIKHKEEYVGV